MAVSVCVANDSCASFLFNFRYVYAMFQLSFKYGPHIPTQPHMSLRKARTPGINGGFSEGFASYVCLRIYKASINWTGALSLESDAF